ncbi:MAG TPA: hypothetical protein PK620_08860 [Denitromonas sp.]|uniref:FmdE family protein n=1 Tax=Denitromonas sp. TaxID=2734609 RepID=UPI001D259D76|nr:hypothetical protein [Rhodocyclaceae bacterium]MCP5222097.1 hypothetical protein [Zoogloeaceae bacterium]HQU89111.1 hypothetical protein [Denitromonas sp.]HQV15013.1 hypothetical protein [Denitromonas sp.]
MSPDFYDQVAPIRLRDPLAALLGAFEGGVYEIGYREVVKLAGHSCPTVAGAYLMARTGLQALYGDELPVRGDVRVDLPASVDEGVTGVVANVLSFITGATERSGFHGLAGQFDRRNLLHFSQPVAHALALTRVDTGEKVSVRYDASGVSADAAMRPLMSRVLSGQGTQQEAEAFGALWQARVRAILIDHCDDPAVISVAR